MCSRLQPYLEYAGRTGMGSPRPRLTTYCLLLSTDTTYRYGVAEAEPPELGRLQVSRHVRLALVDGEDDGHILLAEEGCDIAVEHRAALLAVDDHHSNVSLTQRRERLLSDLRQEDLVGVVVEDLSRVELSG